MLAQKIAFVPAWRVVVQAINQEIVGANHLNLKSGFGWFRYHEIRVYTV